MDAPIGNRENRFWTAYGPGTAYLPLIMVDSGHQIMTAEQGDFKAAYRFLVNVELTRPPKAEIEAYARQIGTKVRVYARLHNTSGVTLSAVMNHAALNALVYEDASVGLTGRIIRAAPWVDITSPLAPDGTLTATIDTVYLQGVAWGALHTVVVADYQPTAGGAFDMLQAAVARPAGLTVTPSAIPVGVDSGHLADRSMPVTLSGPFTLSWSAVADVPWLVPSPDSAAIATQPEVTVYAGALASGAQEGHVTVSATRQDGLAFTRFLTVTAVLGPRRLRAVAPPVELGASIAVPIVLSALGDEHRVSFSLAFDPAIVGSPVVEPGAASATAALEVDDSGAAAGRIGVTVTLPQGETFPEGDYQLVLVTFAGAPVVAASSTVVSFADQPVARSIRDGFESELTASTEDAVLVFPQASTVRAVRRHLRRTAE